MYQIPTSAATMPELTEGQLNALNAINTDACRRDYVATFSDGIKCANQLLKMGLIEKFGSAVKHNRSAKTDRMLVFFKATAAGAELLAKHGLRR